MSTRTKHPEALKMAKTVKRATAVHVLNVQNFSKESNCQNDKLQKSPKQLKRNAVKTINAFQTSKTPKLAKNG